MKAIADLVRELADREAIRDLPVRYCDCLWRKDLEGVIDLFTDDGIFVIRGVEVEAVSRGREELTRTHHKAFAETNPRLFVHNHVVDLAGAEQATGRCYVEVRNAGIQMEWLGLGYFEDKYVKTGERWKFASRIHGFDGMDNRIWLRTFIV